MDVKLSGGGKTFLYSSDFEGVDPRSSANLCDAIDGADVALLDCMYSAEEYRRYAGYGHPFWERVVDLARGARRWYGVHHAPWKDDAELASLEDQITARFPKGALARDGQRIVL